MSFIHKILDRATRHNNAAEEKPQRRSFFGFGATNKDEKPKMEDDDHPSTEKVVEKPALTLSTHTSGNLVFLFVTQAYIIFFFFFTYM